MATECDPVKTNPDTTPQVPESSEALDRLVDEKRREVAPVDQTDSLRLAPRSWNRVWSPEDQARLVKAEQAEAARIVSEERRQRKVRADKLAARRGGRYAECTLENFQRYGSDAERHRQMTVLQRAEAYREQILDRVKEGEGIVLFGRPGTGKDHLLASLMFPAIYKGLTVEWISGVDLYRQLRDAMDSGASERATLRPFWKASIFAISDPLPPIGSLSESQARMLYEVVDERYSQNRPVWVTLNVRDGEEASARLTPQVYRRLRERAVALFCNWPMFEERKES